MLPNFPDETAIFFMFSQKKYWDKIFLQNIRTRRSEQKM